MKHRCVTYLDEVFIHFTEEVSDGIQASDDTVMDQEKPHIWHDMSGKVCWKGGSWEGTILWIETSHKAIVHKTVQLLRHDNSAEMMPEVCAWRARQASEYINIDASSLPRLYYCTCCSQQYWYVMEFKLDHLHWEYLFISELAFITRTLLLQ